MFGLEIRNGTVNSKNKFKGGGTEIKMLYFLSASVVERILSVSIIWYTFSFF